MILHIQRGSATLRRVTGFNLKQAFSLGDQIGDISRVFGIVFAPAPVQYLAPLGSDNANKLILPIIALNTSFLTPKIDPLSRQVRRDRARL